MTPAELRAVIVGGESLTTEFKSAKINDGDLVEAIACLANGPGGLVLIGVENDGRVLGVTPSQSERADPARVRALVEHRTEPHLQLSDLARAEYAEEQREKEDRRRALAVAGPFVIAAALFGAFLIIRYNDGWMSVYPGRRARTSATS